MWILGYVCYSRLIKRMDKHVILIYSSIVYFIFIAMYAYRHIDDCWEHIEDLTIKNISLLAVMTLTTFIINVAYTLI